MEYVECVCRGTSGIDDAISQLNDTRVQLLFTKFLLGGGTFKREKFLYVTYMGPKCNILKRGQCMEKIRKFSNNYLKGIPSLTTADRASLSFDSLISHFKKIFIVDDVEFSKAQIRREYLERLKEEQEKMHQEEEFEKKRARMRKIRARRAEQLKKEAELAKKVDRSYSLKSNTVKCVIDAIRKEDSVINWVIFDPDPEKQEAVAYGCGGIFELVKNLQEDKWFFGLFKISLSNGKERERRLILFQWIGSKAKLMRNRHLSSVYLAMSKLLSPYSYEIYLVGQSDLVPTVILDRCRNAFTDQKGEIESNRMNKKSNYTFDIKNYTDTLIEEQKNMLLNCKELQSEQKEEDQETSIVDLAEMSTTNLSDSFYSYMELYDVEETLRLIMSSEGGLSWAIFEAN